MDYPLLRTFRIDTELVDAMNTWLDEKIEREPSNDLATAFDDRNQGYQTENLLICPDQALIAIKSRFLRIIASQLGVEEADVEPFWLHMLEYGRGGSMKLHKHSHNEDFVFFVYLRDCNDGETVWYLNDFDDKASARTAVRLKPERGLAVGFSSLVSHEGLITYDQKRVCVCGVRLRPKVR